MKIFQVQKAEAMRAGRLLLVQLHQHRPNLPAHHTDKAERLLCPRMFDAVENILRRHVSEEPFRLEDLRVLEEALNLRVSLAGLEPDGYFIPGDADELEVARAHLADFEPGSRIEINGRLIRYLEQNHELDSLASLGQALLRYLDLFRETPELMDAKAIGVCHWAECSRVFCKGKVDQLYCTPNCNMRDFRAKKRRLKLEREKVRADQKAKRRLRTKVPLVAMHKKKELTGHGVRT